jgi:hypothetical protein
MAAIVTNKVRKVFLILYFSGLVLLPIVLIILPADFFDTGKSICISVLLFHQKCFACGITRAIQHLIHLDFKTASFYNNLCFIVLPVLIFGWYKELTWTYKKLSALKRGDSSSNNFTEKNNTI